MRLGLGTRSTVVCALLFGAATLSACQPKAPNTPVNPASIAPSSKPAARPAELPAATYETMKLRVQRFESLGFKDKTTGALIDPDLALARPLGSFDLVPGNYDELTYDRGLLRFARYGYEASSQPYVVEKALPKDEWQGLEDALSADGFFGMPMDNVGRQKSLPLFHFLYTVGDTGYQASFAPTIDKLKKTGPLVTGMFDVLGAKARMPAKSEHMAFAQSVIQGQLRVVCSRLTPDASGDAQDKPFNLRKAEYDLGKGFKEAVVGPLENAFEYPWPAGDGGIQMVAIKLTADSGATYQTVLPVRTGGSGN